MPLKDTIFRSHSHRKALMVTIILILVVFTFFFISVSYFTMTNNIMHESEVSMSNIEEHLSSGLYLIDRGLFLFDSTYDTQLNRSFAPFLKAYEDTGGNPALINLKAVQQAISPDIQDDNDLYIINEDGIIIFSTYETDIGLDFKQWPDVYQEITSIREGKNFKSDRVVKGEDPKTKLRKFGYMPTSDHKYLLEISIKIDAMEENRNYLSYVRFARDMSVLDTKISSIYLHNIAGNLIGSKQFPEYLSTPEKKRIIHSVLSSSTNYEQIDAQNSTIIHYSYIDLAEEGSPSDSNMDLVAEIIYNTSIRDEQLLNVSLLHGFLLVLVLAIIVLTGYILSQQFVKPITNIIEDITIIAHGDLNHSIRKTGKDELVPLEESINLMIESLTTLLINITQQKEELAFQNSRLLYAQKIAKIIHWEYQISSETFSFERNLLQEMGVKDDIYIKTLSDFIAYVHPDDRERVADKFVTSLQILSESECRFRMLFPDSPIKYLYGKWHCESGTEPICIGVLQDITRYVCMKEAQERLIKQIEKNFTQLAILNDEIRNPLAVIVALLNLREDAQYREEIEEQIKRIDRMVDDIDKRWVESDKVRYFLKHHDYSWHYEDS